MQFVVMITKTCRNKLKGNVYKLEGNSVKMYKPLRAWWSDCRDTASTFWIC